MTVGTSRSDLTASILLYNPNLYWNHGSPVGTTPSREVEEEGGQYGVPTYPVVLLLVRVEVGSFVFEVLAGSDSRTPSWS